MVNKAVVLAGGKGTRFYPYTKSVPKEMLPIIDVPSIELIINELIASCIHDICVVSSPSKYVLNDFLYGLNVDAGITVIMQNTPKGTGDAVLCARDFCENQPFALINGDDLVYADGNPPAVMQMANYFEKVGASVIGVQKVSDKEISKYGTLDLGEKVYDGFRVAGFYEKPSPPYPSLYAALGRHVFTPEIFDACLEIPMSDGELKISDAMDILATKGRCYTKEFSGIRFDLGDKNGYLEAVTEYALHDPQTAEKYSAFIKHLIADNRFK
ncbi:MAG: sugar phosphate nucleotidyltransferase [Clostridia bacterium]|nr:sugar phosphate nucleotidyltransferase [Clostridia bacterium]